MRITSHIDTTDVEKQLKALTSKKRIQVVRNSVNRAVAQTRTQARRQVQEEVALKARDVNAAIVGRRAVRGQLAGAVEILNKPIPLHRYGAKQTRKGVTVRVKKSGGRKLVGGHFVATMRSGHVGVFRRKGDNRLPIRERFGPSVLQVLNDQGQTQRILKFASRSLQKELVRRLGAELRR